MDTMASRPDECRRLDYLVNELSSELIRLTGKAVTATIEGILQRIVEGIDVDRGTLIELSGRPDAAEAAYAWARPPLADNYVDTNAPRLKWLLEQLKADDDAVVCGPMPDDPPAAPL